MTSTNSNIKIISPFIEGILGCIDPFGFFNDFTFPMPQNGNSILDDWSAIHQDYNNSIVPGLAALIVALVMSFIYGSQYKKNIKNNT